jgi:NTE family protein
VIASDVSEGRMLVLPQDVAAYEDGDGKPLRPSELKVVDAVRMSMSFPFFYDPATLRKDGREHLIVDGGLLSNFPVWLFDGKPIHRPTFGFRLHPGTGGPGPYYAAVPRPLWEVPLLRALLHAATTAWDERMELATRVRTVTIPTFEISTLDFGLSRDDAERLYQSGLAAATEFFRTETRYVDQYGQTAPGPAQMVDQGPAI